MVLEFYDKMDHHVVPSVRAFLHGFCNDGAISRDQSVPNVFLL